MRISTDEQHAINETITFGERFGYGNLISHLETAWARKMMDEYDINEKSARAVSGGSGYPFAMQDDLRLRGQWDETGKSYQHPKREN